MWPIGTDALARSVSVSCAKMAEPITRLFGCGSVWVQGTMHVLDGSPDPHRVTGIDVFEDAYWDRCLGIRVVSMLGSGAEGPWFKSQPRRCQVTVLGKL